MTMMALPSKLVKIEIDHTKCTTPFTCKKCLQICPTAVFSVRCEKVERLKLPNPEEPGVYKLYSYRPDKCSVCNKCLELCPEGALRVIPPSEV